MLAMVGVCRTTLHHWVKAGRFPAPRRLAGNRTVFWNAEEVEAWLAGKESTLLSTTPTQTPT